MSETPLSTATACPLCQSPGGVLLVQTPKLRIIRAEDPSFPATYRVVWQAHVKEFSDLSEADQLLCMQTVAQLERLMIAHLAPTKINLAALGNFVPHLHWHVIARFDWDSHYPQAVWAPAERTVGADGSAALKAALSSLHAQLPKLDQAVREVLG